MAMDWKVAETQRVSSLPTPLLQSEKLQVSVSSLKKGGVAPCLEGHPNKAVKQAFQAAILER